MKALSPYARDECERRFLLVGVPDRAQVVLTREIEGQKLRYDPSAPYRVALTNIYLSAEEYTGGTPSTPSGTDCRG